MLKFYKKKFCPSPRFKSTIFCLTGDGIIVCALPPADPKVAHSNLGSGKIFNKIITPKKTTFLLDDHLNIYEIGKKEGNSCLGTLRFKPETFGSAGGVAQSVTYISV